ncbi:condensation domain-containing protein [Micromonospora sp. R77]|uniref:condensation domain-containing protein n=1 Tax=Micromonospora sp. R77 TaxID=2925836 RepID=UPI001F6207BB|nr:condensation domain-containing protein [Micromonospora sp. R77]MCI4066804.1 condensation domain-containing protein [Micromonospora sp. R77]
MTGRPSGTGPVPLSPVQTDLLGQQLLDPDDPGEHCMIGWRVEGPVDRSALERAVGHVHRRHESLRAAYRLDDPPTAEPLDLAPPGVTRLPATSPAEAEDLLRRALGEPFDLEAGRVWRLVHVPVGGDDVHLLGLAGHHIALDGWSEAILTVELSAAYNAFVAGREPPDEPAPTLAEVAAERDLPADPVRLDRHRQWWRTDMAGVPQLSYGDGPTSTGEAPRLLDVRLSPRALAGVRRYARQHLVTPYVVLLTAYVRTLADLCGQHDFGVGTPVALRGDDVLDRAVGCLIDVLCLRVRLATGDTDEGDLRRVSETVRRSFAAREIPLNEIVRLANPPRDERPPLFQTVFALQNMAPAPLDLTGTRSTAFRPAPLALPTELFVEVWEHGTDGPHLTVHHRPDQVPDGFARRLADRMVTRVEHLATE